MKKENSPSIVAIGASARAVARSVTTSGFPCLAIDQFADRDTQKFCAETAQVSSLEFSIGMVANRATSEIVIAGGMEHRPDWLQQFGSRHRLLTPTVNCLRQVRDPVKVQRVLKQAGLPWLSIIADESQRVAHRSVASPSSASCRWIRKPLQSGGGVGVQAIDTLESAGPLLNREFLQKFVRGESLGVTFVTNGSQCSLIGVTRQLVSNNRLNPFEYVGSVGGFNVTESTTGLLQRIGNVLTKGFGLRGWFGIDVIVAKEETELIYVLEVNPRYTASMEVLERIACRSLFPIHRHAFGSKNFTGEQPINDNDELVFENRFLPDRLDRQLLGKRYVFNRSNENMKVDERLDAFFAKAIRNDATDAEFGFHELNRYAVTDIPNIGTVIKSADPVCTVWAVGDSISEVELALLQNENRVLSLFSMDEKSIDS